jgi:MFS family permease
MPCVSIWALLPLVARSHLHLGSVATGCCWAVWGSGRWPARWRYLGCGGRVAVSVLLTSATLTLAAATVALAYVRVSAVAAVAVVVAGVAWILVLSILNSQYQGTLPGWAKARGMSYYLVVFQGAGAVSAAAFGVLAQHAGLSPAPLAAAIGLALVALAGLLMPFKAISAGDLMPAGDWPDPQLVTEHPPSGPVLVTVEYRPKPGLEREVIDKLYAGRRARRRTGAVSWCLWVDAADPRRILEQFVVGSWDEHLRQHERVSCRDEQRLTEIADMTDPSRPPTVTLWLASNPNDASG